MYKQKVLSLLILLLTIIGTFVSPCSQSEAAGDAVTWGKVNVPRQGDAGSWVIASNSDITHLISTNDGTMYCCVNQPGLPYTLFKSTNGGISWSYTGGITSEVIDIVTVPGSNEALYYTDGINVFKSGNGGGSFSQLPSLPVTTGTGNLMISTIDVRLSNGIVTLAAGTKDTDAGEYGGVYVLTDNDTNPTWTDTQSGNYDITDVSFSPAYTNDGLLFTVVTDEVNTYLMTRKGQENWNQSYQNAEMSGVAAVSGKIVFPDTYNGIDPSFACFLGLSTSNNAGDIFRIDMTPAPDVPVVNDLNIGTDYGQSSIEVSSLDLVTVNGNTCLFTGDKYSTNVYRSNDSGTTWSRSSKSPSGDGSTIVLIDNTFISNGRVLAATSGLRSAFSRSTDGGNTFSQVSLVDSELYLDSNIDFAPSPNYETDGTIFLLTIDISNMDYNLWRTTDCAATWERIQYAGFMDSTTFKNVLLAPDYSPQNPVVFMLGTSGGTPAVWKSVDNGQTFAVYSTPTTDEVYAWTVIDSNTVFIGCNDGSNTYLYTSGDSGATWSNGMAAGTGLPSCIRVSPNYPQEPVIAVSDQAGWVHYSDDGGQLFRRLPLGAAVPPFNGSVTIAFDPRFTENRIIYAVSDSVQDGIYRFIVGSSEEWEKVDNRLPAGSSTTGVRVSNTGVLYALNSDTVNSADGEGGLERCLIPSSPLLPSFETVLNGLDDGIILNGLWNSGSRVWSVDTTNNRLMTMQDTLAQPARLLYPSQSAVIFTTTNIRLDWEVMEGATEYEWQVDFNGTFSAIPSDFSGTTAASSVYVPDVETGTTYHWRVRATKPLVSPWSERRSFTPASGDIPAGPTLVCPDAGASCDMNRPLFQWNPVDGTSKYEVIVAKDASFRKSVARKTISANVWQIDTDLENGLVYYWKVRGIGSGENTEWSAASAFMVAAPAQAEMQDTLRTQVVEPVPVRQNGPVLLSPSKNPGRTDEKPLFQWEEIKGAQGYELVIAEDESFDSPVLMKTGDYRLNNPVWNCNVNLEDNTAYYWKVRGVFEKGFSEWSLVSAFVVDCSKTVSENHSQPLIINVPYSPPEESSDKGEQWRELVNTMFSPVIQTILVLVVLIRTRRP